MSIFFIILFLLQYLKILLFFAFFCFVFSKYISFTDDSVQKMSNNTLQRKLRYAKAQKTNRRIPQWIQMQSGHKCQWNSKQHNWRRSHLKL